MKEEIEGTRQSICEETSDMSVEKQKTQSDGGRDCTWHNGLPLYTDNHKWNSDYCTHTHTNIHT